jgi:ATP-dependent Clp protease ATP-binding subunit ClpX
MSGKANVEGITPQYALLTLFEGEDMLYRAEVVDEEGNTVEADIPSTLRAPVHLRRGLRGALRPCTPSGQPPRRPAAQETSEVDRQPDGTVKVRTVVASGSGTICGCRIFFATA